MAVHDAKVMSAQTAYAVDGVIDFSPMLVQMLARMFVRNQLEATIELGLEEVDANCISISELNKYYTDDVPNIAIDYIRDHMNDLTSEIERAIHEAHIKVVVRSVKCDDNGKVEDIDVDYSFN